MSLGDVILNNLMGFDAIVFLAAVLNGFIYWKTRKLAGELSGIMHLHVYVPGQEASAKAAVERMRALREEDVVALRKRAEGVYTMFATITSIFPLLGILGTVVSLLPLVADMSHVEMNFFGALTSTFWGLVFAILFKVLDGLIAPLMEENEKTVALYLSRNRRHEECEEASSSN